jgi:hypothetical protein
MSGRDPIPDRDLLTDVELGLDAKQFLHSPLGRRLLKQMQDDIDGATEELTVHDVNDTPGMQALQDTIELARKLPRYINERLLAGQQAEETLTTRD